MISQRLNEALANRYVGAHNLLTVKAAFDASVINEAIKQKIPSAFPTECSVVFSDISGFSQRTSGMSPEQIRRFLDSYYAKIIPIIYKFGGLIDQMFGDGIIAVFSPELSSQQSSDVFSNALKAAQTIVKTFVRNQDYSTKCALHKDNAVICEVGDEHYRQATIIGEIMTIVHRVESVAKEKAVNMLLSIPEAQALYKNETLKAKLRQLAPPVKRREMPRSTFSEFLNRTPRNVASPEWTCSTFTEFLKGVGTEQRTLLCIKYVS